jgi:hypothetical protein
MTKNNLLAALPLILSMTIATAQGLPPQRTSPFPAVVGHETTAPPWSAACMSDHGPTQCSEPMWVYSSSAAVPRTGKAH